MNPVKKILVNFKKPRGIYDPHNMLAKPKWNPSDKKEHMRMERRLKKINRYDDEETGEPPIEALTTNKAKLIFRMLTEYHNNHRLARKEIPKEEKVEFIKKCKEFSLYRSHLWRKEYNEMTKCLRNEEEMLRISFLLPMPLVEEVLDIENVNDEGEESASKAKEAEFEEDSDDEKFLRDPNRGYELEIEREEVFKENNENIEALEYTPEFLYLPQVMRIYPDDYHIIFKTLLNLPAYETSKQGGIDEQGDNMMAGGHEEAA